ncbi:hypothetical protein CCR97_04145 [Rhodoplanes elegans]|uniref:Mu-like prophage I protein n=1 Tax=Rhodoplanes elegans TaxID=29408 RepID=A0A327KNG9_9BRAD|nr:phage protease [Rhodoplanes elegans]MBK5957400.1 hypothetical protein [Rhodoplanes elegans]RAI39524.1 hypothetical protein CH338_09120 [Rhodoplanes elegans]
MSPRTATPLDDLSRLAASPLATCDATGVALGVVTLAVVDANAAAGAFDPPEWVQIAPRGKVTARDGRTFSFDPEVLAARFDQDRVELPLDFDHGISKKAVQGERVDAVGWITALQARPEGLFAKVSWLAAGIAALAARTHRYVSPTFKHSPDGAATYIHSAALVTAPALSMPALAAAEPTSHGANMKTIATALGLAETADEAACLAALTTLQTAGAAKVDKAVHDQALVTLAAANEQLATAQAQLAARDKADHEAKVGTLLDGALKDKKIVPAQRDQYAALCATADGLAQVTALLAATPAGLQPSTLDQQRVPAAGAAPSDALLASANALIKTAAEAGRHLSLADAVVQANGGQI